jgi:serine phosphatase RsbU (regulator of sigma subunit)
MTTLAGGGVALVVDDDATTRLLVTRTLEGFGFAAVLEAGDGRDAQELLSVRTDVGLVITDLMMPQIDGLSLLRWGRERFPHIEWIILSGVGTFDAAAEAVRLGAFDFLTKPPQVQQLIAVVRNAVEKQAMRAERIRLRRDVEVANQELADRVQELERTSRLLQRDLERAEIIQRALLPRVAPELDEFCIHAIYRPGAHVGGDLYDVVRLSARHVGIYIADATGHGVTAAMLSVLFKQQLVLLTSEAGEPLRPSAVLAAANRAFDEAVHAPGLFLTAAYALLDLASHEVTIASAGHPPLLHLRADGTVRPLRRTGPALGLVGDAQYAEERITLGGGERLLFYTDGLLPPGDPQADSRLAETLINCGADPASWLSAIISRAEAAGAAADCDDITLLLLNGNPGPSHFDNGAAPKEPDRQVAAARASDSLFYGETEDARFIRVRGRLVWTQCEPLFEAACAFREEGLRLVLDLAECEYLDSTALGTIHQLVVAGGIELQQPTAGVRAMFEELSMDAVLGSVRAAPLSVPELRPLQLRGGSAPRDRMLSAHEALAGLSEHNREAFQQVLRALRLEP